MNRALFFEANLVVVNLKLLLLTSWPSGFVFAESGGGTVNANVDPVENQTRCSTRYPLVLVHGIAFRDDLPLFASWGRIPAALESCGARVYQGGQDAWDSHESSAIRLTTRILEILKESGDNKINLIAHSKGGLEARYMISRLDMADKVASLTTVCTSHRGTCVADLVSGVIPDRHGLLKFNPVSTLAQMFGFRAQDFLARIIGDKRPEAQLAVRELTRPFMDGFNQEVPDAHGVYYQSYGAIMKDATDDPVFALTRSILLEYEGESDGMVSTASCPWGNFRGFITGQDGERGVSHGDMVDYRRDLQAGVDIPGVYVGVVEDLKRQGF